MTDDLVEIYKKYAYDAKYDLPEIYWWICFDCERTHYLTAKSTDKPDSCRWPYNTKP